MGLDVSGIGECFNRSLMWEYLPLLRNSSESMPWVGAMAGPGFIPLAVILCLACLVQVMVESSGSAAAPVVRVVAQKLAVAEATYASCRQT